MPRQGGLINHRDLCDAAVVERVIGAGAVSSLKISATIQSDNYSTLVSGWQINRDTGSAEFQDVIIRGTLNASDITTGTLDASVVSVTNLNADNITTGTLVADRIAANSLSPAKLSTGETGAITITLGTSGVIQSTDASPDVVINGDGSATFKNLTVTGTSSVEGALVATGIAAGNITTGTLSVSRIGSNSLTTDKIELAAALVASQYLQSTSYSLGVSGWKIAADGSAEFNNVTVRGALVVNNGAGEIVTIDDGDFSTKFGTNFAGIYFDASATATQGGIYYGGPSTQALNIDSALGAATGSSMVLYEDAGTFTGQIRMFATNGVRLEGAHPTSDNNFDLGTSTLGWRRLYMNDGTAGAPSWGFTDDTDTGMYRRGANQIGWSVGTADRMYLDTYLASATTGAPAIKFDAAGSATTPTYSFAADTDTGMYWASANVLAFATGTVLRGSFQADGIFATTPNTTGSAANLTTASAAHENFQRSTSARKYKSRITYNMDYLADYELKPAKFYRKDDKRWFLGLIADDLGDQDELLGVYEDGEIDNYDYRAVIAVLAAKVNRLEKLLEAA